MTVSIIAAVPKNRVIGKDNQLVWDLPKDMAFFKSTTKGHHVIMGRKNYESIPEKYRPLPGRPNIVVTRQDDYSAPEAQVVNSIKEGLDLAKEAGEEEAFVIGGGQIYDAALKENLIDVMYLTHIHSEFEGDTYFPKFDESDWERTLIMHHEKDEKNPHDFDIYRYVKCS
ncbi:dihydrofolate reductase [Halocola ammonii]